MRIALVPLDERPVNTELVRDIAAIAGATVELPPASVLPDYRSAGDADAIGSWLLEAARHDLDAAVVSLDMLGFGGLIPSRTNHDRLRVALGRIATLETIHEAHPAMRLGALNVFLRASNSNDSAEEPAYWAEYGTRLHALGARAHQAWLGQLGQGPAIVSTPDVPADVRRDFALRRLRNHTLNLAGLDLLHAGTVQTLLLTADDTAPLSAGSAEQVWVDYWRTLLGPQDDLLCYPGADEVAAVMTARMLGRQHETVPTFSITCVEPDGLGRVAPFENVPLATTVRRQVQAAGGREVRQDADVQLVVHAPAPEGGDLYDSRPPRTPQDLVQATVDAVAVGLDRDQQVAVADCRWPNGADPDLVEALAASGLLGRLVAYGGWNTAGNTVGSTVAAAAATVIGQRAGTFDPEAQRRFLLTRVMEDYGYQSMARHELISRAATQDDPTLHGPRGESEAEVVRARLNELLRGVDRGWEVTSVWFPWRRPFEIGLRLEPMVTRMVG
jgi:hypothetical protein